MPIARDGGTLRLLDEGIRGMGREDSWLEVVSRVMEHVEAEIDRSRWLPLTVMAAFSYAVYFAADVMLQIYSMHPVIVFVLVGGGPPAV